MKPLNRFIYVLSDDEVEKLHDNTLKLLHRCSRDPWRLDDDKARKR